MPAPATNVPSARRATRERAPPVLGSEPGTLDCATLDPAVVGEVELPGTVVTETVVVVPAVVVVVVAGVVVVAAVVVVPLQMSRLM
jgi:hypothetical protein